MLEHKPLLTRRGPTEMHADSFKLQLWIALIFAIITIPLTAAQDPHDSINIYNSKYHPTSLSVITTTTSPSLRKRRPNIRYLSGNWILCYHVFEPFAPSWQTALALCNYWTDVALTVSGMEDNQFQNHVLAMHEPLGTEMGLALQVEVFSMDGSPVSREFMLAVATTMMGYTMRGFHGIFNARLSRGTGTQRTTLWVTMRITGLAALREGLFERESG
ncbi:hypothetical protein MMC28_005842 [Mycoblastus sanguinarius]|nr:hypothetical protein [Mycoblastus sanguinarius]